MRGVGKRVATHEVGLLLEGGENYRVAFRETLDVTTDPGMCRFIKDAGAFGNTGGGHILIGVTAEGRPRWYADEVGRSLDPDLKALGELCASFFGFRPAFEYRRHVIGERKFVGLLYVPAAPRRILIARKSLDPDVAEGDIYFRRGGETVKANGAEVNYLARWVRSVGGPLRKQVLPTYTRWALEEIISKAQPSDTVVFRLGYDPDSQSDRATLMMEIAGLANASGGCVIFGLDGEGNQPGMTQDVDVPAVRSLFESVFGLTLELGYSTVQPTPGHGFGALLVPWARQIVVAADPSLLPAGAVYYRGSRRTVRAGEAEFAAMLAKLPGA